jgi:hypothetical protein
MKKLLLVVVLLAVALYATNPDKADFIEWAQEKLQERLEGDAEEGSLGAVLGDVMGNLGGKMAAGITTADNYYLCSVYTVDMGKEDYKYLGIFKIFIPLQADNPLEE